MFRFFDPPCPHLELIYTLKIQAASLSTSACTMTPLPLECRRHIWTLRATLSLKIWVELSYCPECVYFYRSHFRDHNGLIKIREISGRKEHDWLLLPSWTWPPRENESILSWWPHWYSNERLCSNLSTIFSRCRPKGVGILPPERGVGTVGVFAVEEPAGFQVKHDVSVDVVVFRIFAWNLSGIWIDY